MSNQQRNLLRISSILYLLPITLVLFAVGCGSSSSAITASNDSGQRLEHVSISAGEKSFTFGVLVDGGEKGYMAAGRTFGRNFPENMTMRFESVDGDSFERKIVFKNERTRKLNITIDVDLNAWGTFE